MEKELNYLYTPSNSVVKLPIETLEHELPIGELSWEDFEKLCLRIVQIDYSINDCDIYGIKGDKQDGIDIYADRLDSTYECYQCKNYQKVIPSTLDSALKTFMEGNWFNKSYRFVFCTNYPLSSKSLADKCIEIKKLLEKHNIQFEKWDNVQISRVLKEHPQIVYDFFGREWVKSFNGEEFLNQISKRRKLDVNEVIQYRKTLSSLYSNIFQQYDPGIPSQSKDVQTLTCLLQERFIIQDVYEECSLISEHKKENQTNEEINSRANDFFMESAAFNDYTTHSRGLEKNRTKKSPPSFYKENARRRTSVDSLLPTHDKSIILGDPGTGKSSLLRFITLDLLSDSPQLTNISQEWGKLLPIWLPFANITKHLENDHSLNLLEILEKWFKSSAQENLFGLVTNAFEDERLLLFVDGIDEWTSQNAASCAIDKIQILANEFNIRVVFSGRPLGYKVLKSSLLGVNDIEIAPFSTYQQQQYVLYWYCKWAESISKPDADLAKTNTEYFFKELNSSNELRLLAENPLMLNILIMIKFNGGILPTNKFKALKEITEYLIENHPNNRKRAAAIILHDQMEFELSEIFTKLAYEIQKDSSDGIIRKNDAKKIIVGFLEDYMFYPKLKAKKDAEDILNIGANNIGIIIEKSNDDIAFMHRQFQEYLAAQYMIDSDEDFQLQTLQDYSANPTWHQTILCFFGLLKTTQRKLYGKCIAQIESTDNRIDKRLYLEYLKYEIVLNLSTAPPILISEIWELLINDFEWETNTKRKSILWNIILKSVYNPKIKEAVVSYLTRFFPNENAYSDVRVNLFKEFKDRILSTIQKEFLLKNLINGNEYQRLDASNVLQLFIKDEFINKKIMNLLDKCTNVEILPYALNVIISDFVPSDIKKQYFEAFKDSKHPQIAVFCMKLKVHLKLHTDNDLNTFIKIQKQCRYMLDNTVYQILLTGWSDSEKLLDICLSSLDKPNFGNVDLESEIVWQLLTSCFSNDPKVVDRIVRELTSEKYPFSSGSHNTWKSIQENFKPFPKLVEAVNSWIIKTKHFEPERAYAGVYSQSEELKSYFLECLTQDTNLIHWSLWVLKELWGNDKDIINSVKKRFMNLRPNNDLAAYHIPFFFKDDKESAITILEELMFAPKNTVPDRAVRALIEIDKDYFEKKWLRAFLNEKISNFSKGEFGTSRYVLQVIVANFAELSIVEDYVLNNYKNDKSWFYIILKNYPHMSEIVDSMLLSSQPLETNYRRQLVEKISELNGDNHTKHILSQFTNEEDSSVKQIAGLNYLKKLNYEKEYDTLLSVAKTCREYRGIKYDENNILGACGYLLLKQLPKLLLANPKEDIISRLNYYRASVDAIQIFVDNFDYIKECIEGKWDRLSIRFESDKQKFWSFWARYSNRESKTCDDIKNFIVSNKDCINSLELLKFLQRISPKSRILKEISLRLATSPKLTETTLYAGELLGRNFNDDNGIYSVVSNLKGGREVENKVIALCFGWPKSKELKEFWQTCVDTQAEICVEAIYQMTFLLADNERIMKFFNRILSNKFDDRDFNDREFNDVFKAPLLRRVNKDLELQSQIKERLFTSNCPTEKISLFAILEMVHPEDAELKRWKDDIIVDQDSCFYGYNILSRNWESSNDLFLNNSF